uniref:Spermatosis associated 33 n=2 Tax=Propithecus coquereli TaxID=379532 RepID=A0A2K6GSJ6_PROCO
MGLSESKHTPRKDEEQKEASTSSVPKPKEKLAEKHPQEGRQADREGQKPADLRPGADTAKHQQPSASGEEKPDVKQKSSRKESVIPQIIITRASNETLNSFSSSGSEEQRTICEDEAWGPYSRHRNPSTVEAYNVPTKE